MQTAARKPGPNAKPKGKAKPDVGARIVTEPTVATVASVCGLVPDNRGDTTYICTNSRYGYGVCVCV